MTLEDYVVNHARFGKDERRNAMLRHLRDVASMGLFPVMPKRPSERRWTEYYKLMPYEHREPAGKLWLEYKAVRDYKRPKAPRSPRPPRPAQKVPFGSRHIYWKRVGGVSRTTT